MFASRNTNRAKCTVLSLFNAVQTGLSSGGADCSFCRSAWSAWESVADLTVMTSVNGFWTDVVACPCWDEGEPEFGSVTWPPEIDDWEIWSIDRDVQREHSAAVSEAPHHVTLAIPASQGRPPESGFGVDNGRAVHQTCA